MNRFFYFGGIVIFILSGCKKYPEGGHLFSLSKTEQRITGTYGILDLEVNGIDTSLSANALSHCSGPPIAFSINGFDNAKSLNSRCGQFPTNSWYVTGDKKHLVIQFVNTSGAGELYPIAINGDITVSWDIQRLKKDDLWLKTDLNGREYHLKLQYIH
jgi:hypothetical protein